MVESEEIVEQCLSELEENALARRRKLMEMRAKFANQSNAASNGETDEQEDRAPVLLLFRSYKSVGAAPHLDSKDEINTLEQNVADQLEASKNTKVADTLELNTLAPRKVDWDLRRGIKNKLDKLDRRTNKAINQLIRKRMNDEGKGEDSSGLLAATVGSIGEN